MPVTFYYKRPMEIKDSRLVRLFDPETGRYLHLDGVQSTTLKDWPWLGYRYQAENLKAHAKAEGKPWPYIIEGKDE